MSFRSLIPLSLALQILPAVALASEQVGTLTQIEGDVKVFSHPGKTIQGPAPHALYEGEYYSVQQAKIGDKVERGNIVRTMPGAKARVVFENGDQYNVGSATAYRVFWEKDAKVAEVKMNLMYGKLRGIVEKGGPRSKLQIRTKSATMGVRGTDFFIAEDAAKGGTEVSILRGEVEVKPAAPKAQPVQVKTGYSVEVAPPPPAPKPIAKSEDKAEAKSGEETAKKEEPSAPVVEFRQTTQEDLVAIQKSSTVRTEIRREVAEQEELAKKVQELEAKAVKTTLNDIKQTDPKLYAQIQAKPVQSTEELHQRTVQNLLQTAPKAPAKRKPYKSELEDLEQGAYERYFKKVD